MNTQNIWMRPKTAVLSVALALGLGGLGLAAANRVWNDNPPATLKLADANGGPSRTGFAPVVKKVLPAVVNISSSKVVKTPAGFEGQIPEELRQFFGDNSQGRRGMDRKSTRLNSSHLGIS